MSQHENVKIVFAEMQEWEREFLGEPEAAAAWDMVIREATAENLADADLAGAQVVSCFIRSRIDAAFLARCPDLRLVATRSAGYDHIDLAACAERNITVCNVPQYGENTVAEHTMGLILALTRNIYPAVDRVKRGDLGIDGLLGFDLYGKTLGVIGAGRIGLHVIRMGRAMNMRVVAFDVRPQPILAEVLGFEYADLDALLQSADVVSVHVPLMPATRHLLNAEKLALMKPSAVLVNTSRGGVVDSRALLHALNEGKLAGAALDVLEGEGVLSEDSVLLRDETVTPDQLRLAVEAYQLMHHPKVIVTAHIGFYSREALMRIVSTTVENISGFLRSTPQNTVSMA